jgi:hypothetical protein
MDLKQVFMNSAGRLRSGWRLLVFLLAFIFLFILLGYSTRLALAFAQPFVSEKIGNYLGNIGFRLILLTTALGAGLFCTRVLEGLSWRALGLWFHAGWLRDLFVGSIIGIASLALATAIATLGGGLSFTISARSALPQVAKTLFFSAAL